jgi:hydrogenase nickel incorporation protein HypA/HybF
MHEVGIAQSLMELAAKQIADQPAPRVLGVGLLIGPFSAVDSESLRFAWDVITRETIFEGSRLDIQTGSFDELDLKWLEVDDAAPPG